MQGPRIDIEELRPTHLDILAVPATKAKTAWTNYKAPVQRRIDYREVVEPALGEEEAKWAEGLLKEKGLR